METNVRQSGHQAKIDHVGVVVPDLPAAVGFFIENFDATVEFHLERFVDQTGEAVARLGAKKGTSFALSMLDLGGQRLELLQWWPDTPGDPVGRVSAPNLRGAVHLAIAVSDARSAIQRVKATAGVVILSDVVTFENGPTPGMSNAFLHTPWGLLIELISWPGEK